MVGGRILLVFKARQGILTKLGRFETPTKRTRDYLPLACDVLEHQNLKVKKTTDSF